MLFLILFIICFLGCACFLYLFIDRSISTAYSDRTYELTLGNKRLTLLLEDELHGITENELLKKLNLISAKNKEEEIVIFQDSEENIIVFDTIEFEFEEGVLKRIKSE